MSLVKKEQQDYSKQPVCVLIYGTPGSGKSTIGCSAPKPLFIDLDNNGMKRVESKRRQDALYCSTIEELEADLENEEVKKNYETIVIDTGGALDEIIIKQLKESKTNTQTDGSLSIKAYGILGDKIMELVNKILKDLKKNLVIIYHIETKEAKKNNETIYKNNVLSVGRSKNLIWSMADLGMFISKIGNKVYADMRPSDENYAKSCTELCDKWDITLTPDGENNFLTKCFEVVRKSWNTELKETKIYNREIEYKLQISDCKNKDDLNVCLAVLTSKTCPFTQATKKELLAYLKERAKELGCEYAKEHKKFDLLPNNTNAN